MKFSRVFSSVICALGLISASSSVCAMSPEELLARQEPKLFALLQKYPGYVSQFMHYARVQGFIQPVEQLATVVHELVHVDSAAHLGFYVEGIYYEPYVDAQAWPTLDNAGVRGQLLPAEQTAIPQRYVIATSQNRLGNLVDEINAYMHVLPFVCRNEPASAGKQVNSLLGFLALSEAYLRVVRTQIPNEYRRLQSNRASRGALLLVTEKAYAALAACVPGQYVPRVERDLLSRSGQ